MSSSTSETVVMLRGPNWMGCDAEAQELPLDYGIRETDVLIPRSEAGLGTCEGSPGW